ncbi:MAG: PqiC family protein [Pseudomonadota bacterium]
MRFHAIGLIAALLAGCVGSEAPKYTVAPVDIGPPASIHTSAKTILIAKVSLPSYAKETKIVVKDNTGALVGLPEADWGDDPERAMAYALVRHLTDISGRRVAVDPWPLDGLPDAEIRVRVEEMVVETGGNLRLSGQFAVRRDDMPARNRIKPFVVHAAARSNLPSEVVAAHDRAWQNLAELIARNV